MATARFATRAPMLTRVGLNSARFSPRFNSIPRRFNSSKSDSPGSEIPKPKGSKNVFSILLAVAATGAASYYAYTRYAASASPVAHGNKTAASATFQDYQDVYNTIAKRLQDVDDDPEEGSYGPSLVRYAWHSSGTYDQHKHNGGSCHGTMRFDKEVGTNANAGLDRCRVWLEPVRKQFPWISYGDLVTLSGVTALQEMGGPTIKWRAGRIDGGEDTIPPDGRLPDASKDAQYVRDLFEKRIGFSEEDTVALIGAHALGRCHKNYSGYDGPWTFSPTYFTNDFFKLLRDEKWHVKKWDGPKQYEDDSTKSLMMLPTDYVLVQDKEFKKYVNKFADDQDYFFSVFAKAFANLLELGVEFKPNTPFYEFKRLDDQQ